MTQLPYTFLEKNRFFFFFTESEIVKLKTLSKINHGFTVILFFKFSKEGTEHCLPGKVKQNTKHPW